MYADKRIQIQVFFYFTFYLTKCTFTASDDRHISWARAAVKDNWLLNPWNKEVGAFTNYVILHSFESVEYHSLVSCINCGKAGKVERLSSH